MRVDRARSAANPRVSTDIARDMSLGNSAVVTSNQHFVHRELASVVSKHLKYQYRRPIAPFSRELFEHLQHIVDRHGGPLILDSGCGNGESAHALAQKFPAHLIIGIDKSRTRIANSERQGRLPNLCIVRGDCVDLWRLAVQADWPVEQHYLLYPNPWSKAKHLRRRWHGHPVFGSLIALGGFLEVRSNWKIYVSEFAAALEIVGANDTELTRLKPSLITTPFEAKYLASGHNLFQLRIQLP
ncbi:MAG: methyltransferase domain-containing protein [Gammaproteobacteria bacterium]